MKTKLNKISKSVAVAGILILSIVSGHLLSQEGNGAGKGLYGGFGFFGYTGEQQDLNALGNAFEALGYARPAAIITSYGGGGYFVLHNFLIGGGGSWTSTHRTSNALNHLSMRGGYGMFNFGYIVHSRKRHILFPEAGIGGGGYDIVIAGKSVKGNFADQINTPTDMTTINSGGLLLNFSLGYFMFFNPSTTEGFNFGLKAGYKLAPIEWTSSIHQTNLSNAPQFNMSGVYITILFGGGEIFKAGNMKK